MSLNVPQPSFPAKGSAQIAGVRTKIALKPGRSLMDWIRLGRTAKDLAGTGGKVLNVTPEELAKHSTTKDCWIAIRGLVYNVSPYMEFHPGGEDELMRGGGIDGTTLFDEVHKWVNVESMLEKCFVGKLEGYKTPSKGSSGSSLSSLSIPSPTSGTLLNGLPGSGKPEPLAPPVFRVPQNQNKPRYEWFQNENTVTIAVYSKWREMRNENVIIDRDGRKMLITALVSQNTYLIHLELESDVTDDYNVKVQTSSGKVDVVLHKATAGQWKSVGRSLEKNNSFLKTIEAETVYRKCKLASIEQVTHDTNLYRIKLPESCRMCVPVGYHVHIRADVEGMEISRSYTVVPPSLVDTTEDKDVKDGRAFYLMIKLYADGALTQVLSRLVEGDTLDVSSYEGNFRIAQLENCHHLIMLAAGTGFTPMARLIHAAFHTHFMSERKLHLLFFNKKECDILWREQLEKLKESVKNFTVTYVLSDAPSDWSGLRGRIRKELADQFLPSVEDSEDLLVCACGPTEFTKEAVRLTKEHGIKEESIHAFLG